MAGRWSGDGGHGIPEGRRRKALRCDARGCSADQGGEQGCMLRWRNVWRPPWLKTHTITTSTGGGASERLRRCRPPSGRGALSARCLSAVLRTLRALTHMLFVLLRSGVPQLTRQASCFARRQPSRRLHPAVRRGRRGAGRSLGPAETSRSAAARLDEEWHESFALDKTEMKLEREVRNERRERSSRNYLLRRTDRQAATVSDDLPLLLGRKTPGPWAQAAPSSLQAWNTAARCERNTERTHWLWHQCNCGEPQGWRDARQMAVEAMRGWTPRHVWRNPSL